MTDAELAEARLTALLDAERENTALRAEVERLRGERPAVVRYLRAVSKQTWEIAAAIERGDHRREEKK